MCVFSNRENKQGHKERKLLTSRDRNLFTLKYMFFSESAKVQSPHAYETAFAFIVQIRKMSSSQSMSSKEIINPVS